MRSFILLSAISAVSVFAANNIDLTGIPECTRECTGLNFGNCNLMDVNCICSNQNVIDSLACCVVEKCPAEELLRIMTMATSVCQGHQLRLPATCPNNKNTIEELLKSSSRQSSNGSNGGMAAPGSNNQKNANGMNGTNSGGNMNGMNGGANGNRAQTSGRPTGTLNSPTATGTGVRKSNSASGLSISGNLAIGSVALLGLFSLF